MNHSTDTLIWSKEIILKELSKVYKKVHKFQNSLWYCLLYFFHLKPATFEEGPGPVKHMRKMLKTL